MGITAGDAIDRGWRAGGVVAGAALADIPMLTVTNIGRRVTVIAWQSMYRYSKLCAMLCANGH